MITNPAIDEYVSGLVPPRSPLLQRMEAEAQAEGIPIVQLPTAQVMRSYLQLHRPEQILEVGTAIGYSTIWMAEAAPQARIVTMDIDEERLHRARANLSEAGVADRVEVLLKDATTGLPDSYHFDCLFIDAAKGQYRAFLDLYLPLLRPGGMVLTDNVLFRGLVATPEEAGKRLRPMVDKLIGFNHYLAQHPDLETAFIPVGDGLAVSFKKR
ncbi:MULTISPECIES: O-methyltransferase [Brevibacillus]|jgi:predicted O-methyltransferase YrrM|uniref:tRNA 5-hydroxyuridine methyltransferase n=1 Tax=Brevibacillus borstelensis AK1 TaxID=1300222 RepID=M8D8Z1_9BACL|nr:O-methyltransferase [Brevibacillus borstelensis]EMT52724.1 O-methyltransferase [Brevibacillus borstelensis AK1]KKX55837.1 methyltransferase [Brevibacillus borstelensis cifa_chp40]MBE5396616.1 O-methyltransferase [Brevibacillus borstelensis]MCM3472587.1 O-methyltransferase [Brevibacillus borstelensis]MCM3561849.1 O-methyltransferase [Brevibacillus borstelensis]